MLPPRPLEGIFGDFFVVQAAEDWGHRPDHVLDSQWWPLRGQRAFKALGCGGFGYVFEAKAADAAFSSGRISRGQQEASAAPGEERRTIYGAVPAGTAALLAVKQMYRSAGMDDVWNREVQLMFDYRNAVLADEQARSTLCIPLDAFRACADASGRTLMRIVMHRSPMAKKPFPYPYLPASAADVVPDHRPVPEKLDKFLNGSGCDLVDYLDAVRASPRGCLTNPQIHYIMRQLLTAINFMHIVGDKPLIHRDIKPENILYWGASSDCDDPAQPMLPSDGSRPLKPLLDAAAGEQLPWVKLADFGLARERIELMTKIGTDRFMAPDFAKGVHCEGGKVYAVFDEKVDIFAAGCVLYQLHTMEAPGPKSKEVVPSVEDTTFCQPASPTARFPLAGAEAEGFLDRHCRFWNAFVAMVCPTAAGRPTAAQLLKYDFFFGSEEDDGEFSFCRCAKCREWLTC